MRSSCISSLLVLTIAISACSEGKAIIIELVGDTSEAFRGVVVVRLEASGASMPRTSAEAPRSADVIELPPLPFGARGLIAVEGMDQDRFVVSRGESAEFEVSVDGPERLQVPFARCHDSLGHDADGDGHGSLEDKREGCPQLGWVTSADDCFDGDPLVFPGQKEWFAVAAKNGGFDYNCAKGPEQEFADPALDCPSLGASCNKGGTEGWVGAVPGCGLPGSWGECVKEAGSCTPPASTTDRVQRCH